MSHFQVNNKCNGCLACVQNCPASALSHQDKGNQRKLLHNITLCARCGNCWRICPQEAIEFQHLLDGNWDEVITMDLVHCVVCGEPLYTADFENTLTSKLERNVDALCPRHRSTFSLMAWRRVAQGREKPEGVSK